jgi:hypothetical protein
MTSGKTNDLYRLQKKDIRRAALMLADAFQHDPVWNIVFGDTTLAQRAYAFETPVRYGLKYGKFTRLQKRWKASPPGCRVRWPI